MNNNIDLKFNEGNKNLDFTISGFNEESSLLIVKEIMKVITQSGNEEVKPIKEVRRFELEEIEESTYRDEEIVNNEEEENTPIDEEDPPHKHLNIDERIEIYNDDERYQAYYICPDCQDRGKHKIKRDQIYINCWNCGKRMRVRDAHLDGFPIKDDYGNSFIAGDFKRSDEKKYGVQVGI